MKRWRERQLPPDGDVPTPPPVVPPLVPLKDQDRYLLMTRYRLTPEQVGRLPIDIAWTLLRSQ